MYLPEEGNWKNLVFSTFAQRAYLRKHKVLISTLRKTMRIGHAYIKLDVYLKS